MANPSKEKKERGQVKKFLAFKLDFGEKVIWDYACSVSHYSGVFRSDAREIGDEHGVDAETIRCILRRLTAKGFLIITKASTYKKGRGSRTAAEYKVLTLTQWIEADPKRYEADLNTFHKYIAQCEAEREAEREADSIRYQQSKPSSSAKLSPKSGEGISGLRRKVRRVLAKKATVQSLTSSISENSGSAGLKVSGSLNPKSKPETGNLNFTEFNSKEEEQVKSITRNINLVKEITGKEREEELQSEVSEINLSQEGSILDKGETSAVTSHLSQDGVGVPLTGKATASRNPPVAAAPPFADLTEPETQPASSQPSTESDDFTFNEAKVGFEYPPSPEGWLEAGWPWPPKKRNPVQPICQLCREKSVGETDFCKKHLKWKNSAFKEPEKPVIVEVAAVPMDERPELTPKELEFAYNYNWNHDRHNLLCSLLTAEREVILARLLHKLRSERGDTSIPSEWESQWAQTLKHICQTEFFHVSLTIIQATQTRSSHIFTNAVSYANDAAVGHWEWVLEEKPEFCCGNAPVALVQELNTYSPDSGDDFCQDLGEEMYSEA
jgi:hypothetical protein